jgi:hypothetical protein
MGDNNTQPNAQTGQSSKANGVAGEVGVPHSSVDLHYFKGCKEPRGDTYSMRGGEAKDEGMAGATRIVTPNKVRELQIALYRKAKSCPMNEFGEPNMGNPSVRFDEGRESVGHWPLAFQSSLSRLLYNPAISYNVQWLKDFHHWIRHRNGSHATTIHSDTDRVQGLAVEVGATVRG